MVLLREGWLRGEYMFEKSYRFLFIDIGIAIICALQLTYN